MPKQNIANILLYDMAQKYAPSEFGTDSRVISEVVEGWNKNVYVYPKYSIKFQKRRQKKYDLM